ncbi:PHD-finger [Musa troglodytarum]|uniref:PHD-finger n=1 Tax=Musa troglodytarum TaxID=320322 RepID=A0A9E7H1L6_9LILI|nr:PHD-finger [Musa troglodytarum]
MVSVSAHLPSSFSFAIASNPRRDLSPSSSSSSWIELSVSRKIVPFPRRGDPTSCPGLRLCASKAEVPARRADEEEHGKRLDLTDICFAETFDPELRLVLELATDAELIELEHILFGPSFFSPLLKSITSKRDADFTVNGEFIEEREDFIEHLESQFLYLAADARATLSEEIHPVSLPSVGKKLSNSHGSLEVGLSQWKVLALGALRGGAKELQHTVMKLARKFSGKMLLEAANYEIKHEIIKRGGQLAAINLESKAAELAARQGLAHAASKYLGLRSVMMILGPVMWGTFLADVVIQMLGTDYARILRAIYAFAQIRLTRTYGWRSTND